MAVQVQDDAVFGSRSQIMCQDVLEAAPVVVEAGAMVADRCVILPGATISRNAILGSGSLAPKYFKMQEAGDVWLGSRGGSAELRADVSSALYPCMSS